MKKLTFSKIKKTWSVCLCAAGMLITASGLAAAQGKSEAEINQIKQALFPPSQKGLDVDTLSEQEIPYASLIQEGSRGYILKNASGQIIRTLFDTDGDSQLDQWGFFKNGVEVYRDIDTDKDQVADQMRWFNSAGTRWGVDTNKDGVIDYWKVISPEEVSEEIVIALATRNLNRFLRLAINADNVNALQVGGELSQKLNAKVENIRQAFQQSLQNIPVSENASWGQFWTLRPATIPIGNNRDLNVYYNTYALINDGENSVQIQLGSLVKIGEAWKVIDAPRPYAADTIASVFSGGNSGILSDASDPEIEEMSRQIEELEKKLDSTAKDQRIEIYNKIAELRIKTAYLFFNKHKDMENRDKWLRDLADFMYTAVTVDNYPGIEKMTSMSKTLKEGNNPEVAAYMQFRAIEAAYHHSQSSGTAPADVYTKYVGDLEQLTKDFRNTQTAATVQLNLVGEYEMSAQLEKAKETAQTLIKNYPNSLITEKAAGFLRRIDSNGKSFPFPFQGRSTTGSAVDINQYKGKIILLYFWASWSDTDGAQAAAMKKILSLYERDGLSIIGINLDNSQEEMAAYVKKYDIKWPQIFEEGGQESRPAVYAGINMPPFFILINKEGKVVNNHLVLPEDADRAIFSLIRGE
ncbi:MAG: TlpA family protein disulfide reductase [Planctomycetaceae bacterium]|jgi:peroxiredoxin|nr:TlpA family protein disulfide reductase [Planctomycetaceae bacterium]